jgi:hypothetical protein
MECKHGGKFISPDFKKILCEVHKEREDNHQEYIKISQIGHQLGVLLDKLEIVFIDFQTCLAIVETFLQEERALKIDFNTLNKFQDDLNGEIEKLNDWFEGGTALHGKSFTLLIRNSLA